MNLTFPAILYAMSIMFDLTVVSIVAFHKPKNSLNRYYVYAVGLMSVWEIILWLDFFWKSPLIEKIITDRISFSFGPIILILVVLFLQELYGKPILSKQTFIWLYILIVATVLFCITGLVRNPIAYYGVQANQFITKDGPFIYVYYLSYLPLSYAIFKSIWKIYCDIEGFRRLQAKYIILGLFISFSVVTITNIWYPLYNVIIDSNYEVRSTLQIFIQTIGGISCTIWTGMTAYAITRYRLFDIRFVIHKGLMYFLSGGATVLCSILFAAAVQYVLNQTIALSTNQSLSVFGVVVFLTLMPLNYVMQRLLYRLSVAESKEGIDFSIPKEFEFLHITHRDLDYVYDQLQTQLRDKFQIEHIVLFIYDWKLEFFQSVKHEPTLRFSKHHIIAQLGQQNPRLFVVDQPDKLVESYTQSMQQEIYQFMRQYNFSAMMPLRNQRDIYGFIFIPKADFNRTQLHSQNRVDELETICKELGNYIEGVLVRDALIIRPDANE